MTKSETRFEQGEAFIAGYHAGWGAERGGPGPGKLFEEWFRDQESKRERDSAKDGAYPCNDRRGHQFDDADGNRVYSTCQRGCGTSDDEVARPDHNDGPRSDCPGCRHADTQRAEMIADARRQLSIGPANLAADHLAVLLLNALGEKP